MQSVHEATDALTASIEQLWKIDRHLLEADSSERSLTHRLAVHLSAFFPDYHVDCEYNRDGFDVKRLELPERGPARDDSVDAVTVFPDIIVHERGSKKRNLLVVEVKKVSSRETDDYDLLKLRAFKSELDYTFAAHLRIGLNDAGTLSFHLQFV